MMNFASRTSNLSAEGAYAVLARAQELERKGKSIIHLEIGQPDFSTPSHVIKEGIAALKAGKTKYNPPLGINELRNEVAQEVSVSHGKKVTSSQVAITPGGKVGIYVVLSMLINPGDEVIYPNPGFPTYEILIDYFGGKRVPVTLLEKNNFSFDMEKFKKSISSKTKLIIINSPSNPTGSVIPMKDLKEIARIAKEKNIWVLSDEIYSKILYDGKKFNSIWSLPGMSQRTFVLDGFSKTYSMTGWRLGYLVCPENSIEKINYLLTHMVGCTSTFTQYAGVKALTGSQNNVDKMVSEFEARRNYLVRALNNIPGVSCLKPSGAFYVFPNVKSFGRSSDEIANLLLEEGGLAVLSGSSFGEGGEGYLRISYASSLQKLKQGVKVLEEILPRIKL